MIDRKIVKNIVEEWLSDKVRWNEGLFKAPHFFIFYYDV